MIATPPIEQTQPDSSDGIGTEPMVYRRQRRPGDALNRNTADLPPHQRDALRWLHAYGDQQGMTNKALGAVIGYSEATISRLFATSGMTYEGSLDEITHAIETARSRIESQHEATRLMRSGRMPFIRSELSNHIWSLIQASGEYRRIVPMWGEAQIGKSRAAKEYAAKELGRCIYVEMPTGGALNNFLANLCGPCRISTSSKSAEQRRRVIDYFADGETKLIVDQMHRAFMDASGRVSTELTRFQLTTLDFIIELFDAGEPGITLIGANVFRDGYNAIANANFFRQIRGRSLHPDGCQLPNLPGEADLNAFAAHYGLAPATGEGLKVQTEIIRKHGLAVWLTRMHSASMLALNKGRPLAWDDIVTAHAFFTSLSRYNQQEAAVK